MAIRYIDFMGRPHGDLLRASGGYFLLVQRVVRIPKFCKLSPETTLFPMTPTEDSIKRSFQITRLHDQLPTAIQPRFKTRSFYCHNHLAWFIDQNKFNSCDLLQIRPILEDDDLQFLLVQPHEYGRIIAVSNHLEYRQRIVLIKHAHAAVWIFRHTEIATYRPFLCKRFIQPRLP